jgi:hypothetical protein
VGATPQPVVGQVWRVPAFIAARAESSDAWTSGPNRLALSWNGEAPIPSLAALKSWSPGVKLPAANARIAWLTADSRCFSALVMMQALAGAPSDSHWSTSTPMP